jgi:serine protease Do
MKRWFSHGCSLAVLVLAGTCARAAEPTIADIAEEVNKKVVKVFGAGGIRGLPSYGTGILVSGDGYILTANSHILDTADLRVHIHDGTRYHCKVVAMEPELDIALIKIETKEALELPFFNVYEAAKQPLVEPGTGVLAFSNQFLIATRNEPVSVMRGVVASYCKLHGRIGIFEAPYTGNVYVIDAITNNPGAAGGVVTTRKGQLLGLIGKELRNELTNTWINYCLPIQARIEIPQGDGTKLTRTVIDLVDGKDKYKPIDPNKKPEGGGGYHGIQLVLDPVDRTPPYVEDVEPGSPAEKAGLKPDDLIVYVDGLPVPSIQMFKEIIGKYRPNTDVKLEVRRGDKLNTVPMKLTEPPKPPKKTTP